MPDLYWDIIQVVLFFAALILFTPLLGKYLVYVFGNTLSGAVSSHSRCERWIYAAGGVDPSRTMNWRSYSASLLVFNILGGAFLFGIQLIQHELPLNPLGLPNVAPDLALNTAVSFMTNTNWQSYAGETTLSYLVQLVGLTVQNFLSAATGIAVLLALIRGLTGRQVHSLGNFWVDLTRSIVYVLLPLTIILAVVLVGEGVIQNFSDPVPCVTMEGAHQAIPMGPAASQIAIKQIGTNGGGFFSTNSAHPFENPTPLSNFLELLAILLLPSALVYAYGRMVGSRRHGWTLWGTMMFFLVSGIVASTIFELQANPVAPGSAPMEGKEVRFGVTNSVLWSVATTAASNGSVNAMHDSLSPISGLVALLNIMLGEIIFGGVGAGMYGMFVFVVLTVFIAGLMVGRSPEYLGKRIEAFEIQMASLAVILPSALILVFSAIAVESSDMLASISNAGPHGLTQVLYAFSSAAGNNGSAFAGLNTNTVFYNLSIAAAMLVGRFGVIIPVLAIAGSLASKKITPPSTGTFRTDNLLFAILLVGVIVIVGALTFLPALSLGPIVEQLLLTQGHSF
jgi:potassium-transporting ATPase potassium-binding subunit